MSLRGWLSQAFSGPETETTADATDAVPLLSDPDVDPPEDAPETCPNCGEAYDDVLPLEDVGSVRLGDHRRMCHIGTDAASPLAGWRVIHR